MRIKSLVLGTAAALLMAGSALAETIIIGHFGNPSPMQMARAEGKFEAATGWDIEWRKFDAGTDVIAAMAAGDVMLAELGSSPTAIATSQGVEIQLFMLAAVLGTAESLIAREGSGIETLADLKGKKVGVPLGSTAHYSLMGALKHEGIAESEVELEADVPEATLARMRPGQPALVEAAGFTDPLAGRVRLVAPEVNRTNRLGRIRVTLTGTERPPLGAFGRATVEVARVTALSVPLSAVMFAETPVVQVVRDGVVETRKVVVGLRVQGRVEIREGLAEGEQVVSVSGSFVRHGDRVAPVLAQAR